MIWGPCAFLFLFSIIDIYVRLKSRYSDIPWSFLNISKSIVLFLLICLTFYDMAMILSLWSNDEGIVIYDVQVVSVSVKAATFVSLSSFPFSARGAYEELLQQIFVSFLQLLHKIKGHSSSGLLFLFWLMLTVFAGAELRWEIQNYDGDNLNTWTEFQFINYITYFSLISVMLLLNCFADKPPRSSTFNKSSNPSPELRSSFIRQIFFQWFDKTTWVGWRRPLTEKDIYDINPEDTSRELVPPFDKYFAESAEKGRR